MQDTQNQEQSISKEGNRAICILGMHRSGTSAVARVLNLLGVYLGKEENIMPPGPDNPEGFWENTKIVEIHDRLLQTLGYGWDTTLPLPHEWWRFPEVKPFKEELKKLVTEEFSDCKLWGWKDPRTCILLPLWIELLKELKVDLSFVIVTRNPLEVADSLTRRNGFPAEKGWAMWFLYVVNVLHQSQGYKRAFISYEDFMQDWKTEIRRVATELSIPWPEAEERFIEEVGNFIKPQLRHHTRTPGEALSLLPKPIADLYKLCLRKGEVNTAMDTTRLNELFRAYEIVSQNQIAEQKNLEILNLQTKLEQKDHELQETLSQLAAIESSLAFKLLASYRRWRERLLPEGTRRYRLYRLFIKAAHVTLDEGLLSMVGRICVYLKRHVLNILTGGPPLKTTPQVETGFYYFVERATFTGIKVSIEGWAFHELKRILSVTLEAEQDTSKEFFPLSHGHPRADVARDWPFENAYRSGFRGSGKILNENCTLTIVFQLEDCTDIRVPVDYTRAKQPSNWKKVRTLFRSVNGRRIRTAIKLIITGNFRSIKWRIQELLKNSEAITPTLYDLADSMNLFYKNEPELPPLNQEIDIIIPVYNGFEFLPNLFNSIKNNTTSPYRLVIVDDCSTDQRVKPLLEQIARDYPKTVLLHNTENKGFVSSVNSASKYIQNHFVLLNTDVEVPPYWLERLMRPILEDPNIASSTPFSNAATVCSFPNINEDNEIFAGLTVDQVDRLFRYVKTEAISIELPSGVGFCMGVNYNVVKKIGLFDEETFGKGYGEENDWCLRAKTAGYRNVMVPNLFVYHKHGGSFEHATKIHLMQENLAKLLRRYPDYLKQVDDLIKRDPAAPIRHFLVLALSAYYADVKPILIIDHEIGGGANTYRSQLTRERLGIDQPVLLLTYDRYIQSLKLQCLYKEYEVAFAVSNVNHIKTLTEYVALGEIFYNNLVSFKSPLDVVALMVELKKSTGVPLTLAIHDFFPLCPSYNLLNNHGVFCNLPDLAECRKCLPRNTFAEVAAGSNIDRWREQWSSVFSIADKLLCFSENSRTLVNRIYPHCSEKTAVQPHTVKDFPTKRPKLDFSRGLNIGVVGAIGYPKGSKIIIEMAKLIAKKKIPARITVIGTLEGALVPRNITVTGPYKLSELPDLLERHNVNICFLPSICPETFSYVTSELMQLNMPICCFDLGAPAERVQNYELGYIISEINPAAALKEILAFFDKLVIKCRYRE